MSTENLVPVTGTQSGTNLTQMFNHDERLCASSARSNSNSARLVPDISENGHYDLAYNINENSYLVPDSARFLDKPVEIQNKTNNCPNCLSSACNCKIGHYRAPNVPSDPLSGAWINPLPYPYQIEGAIQATLQNRTLIADEPGLGKTLQAIMAAHLMGARKILVICPPSLIANWAREVEQSNHLDHIPSKHASNLVTIQSRGKTPDRLPRAGYVITSDTLTTARPALEKKLRHWQPDLLIIDESHRCKNPRAKRTRTLARVSKNCGRVIALTGTPIISNPIDLLPTLGMLKKLDHFPGDYVHTYTVLNYWGEPEPNYPALPDLYQRLTDHVWVRRTKKDVLTQLPDKTRHTQIVSVDDKTLRAAFRDVERKLLRHVDKNGASAASLDEWVSDSRPLVSQLRRATGVAKIPAALDWITSHVTGTGRPLIVWAIHTTVINQLHNTLTTQFPELAVEKFYGQTPHEERDQIVQQFQAGKVQILIAQVVAAGVGLTLTAAQDALFLETDWTPALVVQAEDRIHRISQVEPVSITTLVAERTLDPVIHRVLGENIRTLDALTPGSDHHVTDTGSKTRVSHVLRAYANNILKQEGK